MRIKLKRIKKGADPVRYDLGKIPQEYNVEVQNKFATLMTLQEAITPDEIATEARDILISTAQNMIPRKKRQKQNYITVETLQLIEERKKLKQTRTHCNNEEYRTCARKVRRAIRKDKQQHIINTCKTIEDLQKLGKDGDMFREIRTLTSDFRPQLQIIEDKNGKTLTESKDIAERWKDYCIEMYNDNTKRSAILTESEDKEPEPLLEEVRAAIKNLRKGRSPGCDDIPAEFIQAAGEAGVRVYHALCVKIWNSAAWPEAWKRSIYIPFPKKGNLKLCTNYRTIALISHASKILLRIIMQRIERKTEIEVHQVQAGFRKGRGTRDHIFNLRNIFEKCREFNVDLYACFIDYTKAFDCVQHEKMWNIMKGMGFPTHLIHLIESLYHEQKAAVRTAGETSTWFEVQKGVRQGCILSPYLFNIYAENIMRNVKYDETYGKYESFTIGGNEIPELRYADDTVILSNTPEGLEHLILAVKIHSEEQNLQLNIKKTKIMTTDRTTQQPKIRINGEEIENVTEFEYLGSVINSRGDCFIETKRRLAMAMQRLNNMKKLWQNTNTSMKIKLLRACIFPVATYGCESWTITQTMQKKIQAFETRCYRKVLKISWTEKKRNIDILKEINTPEGWLMNSIMSRKLKYFGHIKRQGGLESIILEGMVPGKRGRGRPKRRWTQDITEALDMSLGEAGALARDRESFRLAVKRATFYKGQAT